MAMQTYTLWMLLWVAVSVQAGRADQPQKHAMSEAATAIESGTAPAAATIEMIMQQAVRNIGARYSLNDAQKEITEQLMKREVHRFLKEHENEVWPVIRDLLAAKLGTKPPGDREEAKRIGKAARPLTQLAKEAIFRANEEWRAILTPEQTQVHDFDLAEMEKTFEQIDKNFGTWEVGRPTEDGIFPRSQITGREPPRPPKPPEVPPERWVWDPKEIFEAIVEKFIEEYELDEGQITAARSILEEFKGKANDYKASKKLEFGAIAAERAAALEQRDLTGVKKAAATHKGLLKPIFKLTEQMEGRLMGLLTTAQIERYAEKSKNTEDRSKPSVVTKKTSPKKTAPSKSESADPDSQAQRDKE